LIDKVQVHGVVDAHTSIAMMQQADVLLLLLNKNKNYRGIYSTKVFEYLGCCRPILALIDKNDVVNELLESCKAAYIADFDDILEIEKQIMLAYNDWKNNIMLPFEYDKIERLHRKYEIEKISVFLNINAR
jgi:tRNA U34 5-carboxymethylaminomethyl modifying GTPase MnmE/TrmE